MQDGQQPNDPGWVFKPGDQPGPDQPSQPPSSEQQVEQPQATAEMPAPQLTDSDTHVEWTASEYVANPKTSGWFGALIFCSALLAGIGYFFTREIISAVVILVAGILFAVFAARQPRTLRYAIGRSGIQVGEKFYPYDSFKYFSVAHEHALGFISLAPLRRFVPPLTIHYAPDDEQKIVGTLADYLPYKEHEPDIVENITRRIRF